VILNRWHSNDPSSADAAAMLGYPVAKTFPNDHLKVRDAIMNSRPVAADSQLGRAYTEFASVLLGLDGPPVPVGQPGKFKSWLIRK
jgi:hypothetical protein